MFLSGQKLTLETSTLERILILLSTVFIIIIWLLPIAMWSKIPDIVPSHFSFSGIPDKWSSKSSLLILPVITTIIYIFLIFLRKIPHYFNYTVKITNENAEAQYRNGIKLILVLNLEITAFMLYISSTSIYVSLNKTSTLGAIPAILFMIILFSTLGYFIFKMYKLK